MAAAGEKRHAVCVPFPAQGHITPMMKLARLLHSRGFAVTFVLNEYNRRRLLRSRGPRALDGFPGFRFAAIPDGLPPAPEDADVMQDIPALHYSTMTNYFLPHLKELLAETNATAGVPPVTCIITDGTMTFAIDAARELGVPCAVLWTASACAFLAYRHYQQLVEMGLVPLQDVEQLRNGYLDTAVDWVSGLSKAMRLRDFPSFIRTTSPDDIMLNSFIHETARAAMADAFIVNTFDDLERPVLDAMAPFVPQPVYTLGPLHLLASDASHGSMGSNLWAEHRDCLSWLDSRMPESVVYVNYGSIAVMSKEQLLEFAWGLANSGYDFLWIMRPDLVGGNSAVLPPEFLQAVEGRGLLTQWCPQEEVMKHPAVGMFLTHSGWNSTLEAISNGIPMLSWPFFAEQQTNCRYKCVEWGNGMEIGEEVRRENVAALITEVMGGGKAGKEMKRRALEWKEKALAATLPGGSSHANLEKLLTQLRAPLQCKHE